MEARLDVMPATHPLMETQIQRFSLSQSEILYDTMKIVVYSPDGGLFVLMFLHPTKGTWIKSETITAGADAATFKAAIKVFYTSVYGVAPIVTLDNYTADFTETTEGADDVAILIYTIEVPSAIGRPSVENIMLVPMSTFSDIEFVYSTDIQLSSPPLSGSYWLKCYDTDGTWYSTQDIPVGSNANFVYNRLVSDCSFLKDKISVSQITSDHPRIEMGVEFEVHFHGMTGALENFEMINSADDPIIGATMDYTSATTRPYGESIIFPVVPPEYFFTNE